MWSRAPLLGFDAYRQNEALLRDAAVGPSGALLEYETLALRVDPPNVTIDNNTFSDCTRLTIDSANRPGTLVEVVQCLTELSLSIVRARISSDGGWFINELHICEPPCGRVTNERKLAALRRMLSVGDDRRAAGSSGESRTVLQMVGPDARGILADITTLLIHNGLDVRSAALWTFRGRAACVITATDPGGRGAVADAAKLARLREILGDTLASRPGDSALVEIEPEVHGPVHHERRLHQLMLADEHKAWQQLVNLQRHPSLPFPARIPTPDDPAVAGSSPRGAALFSPSTDALLRDQEPPELGERTRRLQDEVVALEVAAGALSLGDERSGEAAAGTRDQDRGSSRSAVVSPRPPAKAGVVAALPQLPELRVRSNGDAPAAQQAVGTGPGPASDAGSGSGGAPRGGGGGGAGSAAGGSSEPSTPRSQPATPRTPSALSKELSAGGTPLALPPGARLRVTTPPQVRAGAAAGGMHQQQAAGGVGGPPKSPLPPLPPGGPYATAVAAAAAAAAGGAADSGALPHPPVAPVPGAFLGAAPVVGATAGEDGVQRSPHPAQHPMVSVRFNNDRKYWQVEIRCRDRNKLCFDTVCTLADLRFDVYHAALDSEGGVGSQLFYCRPRFGPPFEFDQDRAATLQAMLVSAVQRRFPPGLKLLVYEPPTAAAAGSAAGVAPGGDAAAAAAAAAHPAIGRHGGQLAALAAALRDWGLSVTRCKVREPDAAESDNSTSSSSGSGADGTSGASTAAAAAQPLTHTFYLAAGDGRLPSRDVVRQACESAGGEEIPEGWQDGAAAGGGAAGGAGVGVGGGPLPLLARGKWAFAFAQRGGPAAAAGGGGGGGGGSFPASAARQLPRRKSAGGGSAAAAVAPAVWQAEAHASSFESGHTLSF